MTQKAPGGALGRGRAAEDLPVPLGGGGGALVPGEPPPGPPAGAKDGTGGPVRGRKRRRAPPRPPPRHPCRNSRRVQSKRTFSPYSGVKCPLVLVGEAVQCPSYTESRGSGVV